MSVGIRVIKDPEVAKLLADETRRYILQLLRHHEMSATDLAKALKKSHSSIVHHLNILKNVGLIEETRTEKVRNMVQPYYQSVAHRYLVSYSLSEALAENESFAVWKEDIQQRTLEGLDSFGFFCPEEKMEEVRDLIAKAVEFQKMALEETVERQENPKELGRNVYHTLVRFLTHLKLSQDPEYKDVMKTLASIIKNKESEYK